MNKMISTVLTGLLVTLMAASSAYADYEDDSDKTYEVTITNLTQAQRFTPILVASHKKGVRLASPELADIAEGGAVGAMTALLLANPDVIDVADSGGLLNPGDSVTVVVSANDARYISLASMLIPTNDAFFALNGVKVRGRETVFRVPAYDAGSETNDEDCDNIPGPDCGGAGFSPADDGEGYVYIHGGIHGTGDLEPEIYDWRNPVARVKVVRVK